MHDACARNDDKVIFENPLIYSAVSRVSCSRHELGLKVMGRYVPRSGWAEQKTSRESCCGNSKITTTKLKEGIANPSTKIRFSGWKFSNLSSIVYATVMLWAVSHEPTHPFVRFFCVPSGCLRRDRTE
jgi:hypothetical protein